MAIAKRVDDIHLYSTGEPPDLSGRCRYWIRRMERGWRGNKRFANKGHQAAAKQLGVYIWEWVHILSPMLERMKSTDPDYTIVADNRFEEPPHEG